MGLKQEVLKIYTIGTWEYLGESVTELIESLDLYDQAWINHEIKEGKWTE